MKFRYRMYVSLNVIFFLSNFNSSFRISVLKNNPSGYNRPNYQTQKKHKLIVKNKIQKNRVVHQLVAEAFLNHVPCGYDLVINHINFNKLDNRIENLEIVTARENTNQKHIPHTSKYTGVSWYKNYNKWRAQIWINGKPKCLGYFNNEHDAYLVYQEKLEQIING